MRAGRRLSRSEPVHLVLGTMPNLLFDGFHVEALGVWLLRVTLVGSVFLQDVHRVYGLRSSHLLHIWLRHHLGDGN